MSTLENRYVNLTAADVIEAMGPLGTQTISGSADPVGEFEKEVATLFGRRRAVAVCSGTVSVYAALQALDVGPGAEVILPATAVVMSGLPVLQLGAEVRCADTTEAPGLGLDVKAVDALVTPKTKAVISVPLWGYPVPMDDLVALCKARNIPLIEDIAQCHGSTWNGKLLGTFGVAGCMSTHERKLITTGEGGVVMTDSDEIANRVDVFRRYGIGPNGAGHQLGSNYKLPALSAAVGRTQTRKLHEKIAARSKVAAALRARLAEHTWLQELPVPTHSQQNFYALTFRVTSPYSGRPMAKYLADKKILSDTWRYGFSPLYEYPLFAHARQPCPNAAKLIPELITLPAHEGMTDDDVGRVAQAIVEFKKTVR